MDKITDEKDLLIDDLITLNKRFKYVHKDGDRDAERMEVILDDAINKMITQLYGTRYQKLSSVQAWIATSKDIGTVVCVVLQLILMACGMCHILDYFIGL